VNALGAVVWGLVTLPIVAVHNLPPAALIFLLSGAVWGPYSAIETTALQRWTDPATHGALFGTQRGLLAIASPIGAAAGAVAVDHYSPAVILATSALSCTLAGALAAWPLRRSPGIERLSVGTGQLMSEFRKGDTVEWDSHGGTAYGKVERKITERTEAGGRTVDASPDEPQYLVRSEKSGGTAVHKLSAFRRKSS
jgi:hypothetical protein